MIYTPKSMVAGSALTASAATYYTSPTTAGALCAIIKDITLCNTNTATMTVTVYVIPLAGTAGVANTIISSVSIASKETIVFCLSKVMPPGSFLQALASTGAVVSLSVSGVEVTS